MLLTWRHSGNVAPLLKFEGSREKTNPYISRITVACYWRAEHPTDS